MRMNLKGKRRPVVLARARSSVPSGKGKFVRLRFGRAAHRIVKRQPRAHGGLAIARVRDGAGNRRVGHLEAMRLLPHRLEVARR